MQQYDEFIEPDDKETLEEIEAHEVSFDPKEQNKILAQSTIYLDPTGAYETPCLESFESSVAKRIDTIRDNMYMLPVMNETTPTQMVDAIYYVNEKGERIENEPIS